MLGWSRQIRHSSRLSARELLRKANADINAFVAISDTLPSKNGALSGRSVAVKDNICTEDMTTTCSSNMLRNFTSPFDATAVKLLRDAGADIVGKTNCDEFGMGSLNVHSAHGPVINPFRTDARRSAGGSSGGSAAAVAANLCDVALGTDTGGSIRLPGSYCGTVGFKPSYGLISRWGIVSYADSLDCVGILGNTVDTISPFFKILNRHDPLDPTSVSEDTRSKVFENTSAVPELRIGIPAEYFPAELAPSILHNMQQVLDTLGSTVDVKIVPVSLPSTPYALSAYYVIASAEANSNLARYDGVEYGLRVHLDGRKTSQFSDAYALSRTQGFGAEVKRRILLGAYSLISEAFDNYFLQALKVRQRIRGDYDKIFRRPNVLIENEQLPTSDGVDVILHPTSIRTAPPLSETGDRSKLDAYVQDIMTVPASLAGLPALSVPIIPDSDDSDKWPIGLSIVGQWGSDELVLSVGRVIEEVITRCRKN